MFREKNARRRQLAGDYSPGTLLHLLRIGRDGNSWGGNCSQTFTFHSRRDLSAINSLNCFWSHWHILSAQKKLFLGLALVTPHGFSSPAAESVSKFLECLHTPVIRGVSNQPPHNAPIMYYHLPAVSVLPSWRFHISSNSLHIQDVLPLRSPCHFFFLPAFYP